MVRVGLGLGSGANDHL